MRKILILSVILNAVYPKFVMADVNSIKEKNSKLTQSLEEVRSTCSGIKKDYDLVFGLNTGSAVVSALGTLSGAGALTAGIIKAKKDKSIRQQILQFGSCHTNNIKTFEDLKSAFICLAEKRNYIEKLKEEVKKSKMLGHVRTGLLAGATATSATSMGLSIGSVVNIKKMAEKMIKCNKAIYNLNLVKNELKAEIEGEDTTKPEMKVVNETIAKTEKVLTSCEKFDDNIVKKLYNQSVGSATVSGVGTGIGLVGTITSAMANSKKIRENNTDKGEKIEKNLNLVANISAGAVTATSGVTTVISGVTAAMAKKESNKAGKCEDTLNDI